MHSSMPTYMHYKDHVASKRNQSRLMLGQAHFLTLLRKPCPPHLEPELPLSQDQHAHSVRSRMILRGPELSQMARVGVPISR